MTSRQRARMRLVRLLVVAATGGVLCQFLTCAAATLPVFASATESTVLAGLLRAIISL